MPALCASTEVRTQQEGTRAGRTAYVMLTSFAASYAQTANAAFRLQPAPAVDAPSALGRQD
eukprot:7632-Prymnesium_polylepis.1